jgi:hypothetical protein
MNEWLLLAFFSIVSTSSADGLVDLTEPRPAHGQGPVVLAQWDEDEEDDFDMPEGDFDMPDGDDVDEPEPKKKKKEKEDPPPPRAKKEKKKKNPDADLFVDEGDLDDDILIPADDDEPPPGSGQAFSDNVEDTAPDAAAPADDAPSRRRRLIAGDEEEPAPPPPEEEKPRRVVFDDEPEQEPEERGGVLQETTTMRLDVEEPESDSVLLDPLTISAIGGGATLLFVGLVIGTGAAAVITGPPVLGLWNLPEGFVLPFLGGTTTGTVTIEVR